MQRLAGAATDGIDQDVDATEVLEGLGDHPVDIELACRVGCDRETV